MNNDEKWVKYGKLLSGLIHNLNTPLMGISGRVELLQIKMGEDKSLIQITTQVERINSMLTSAGYMVDKDNYNKVAEIDLAVFMEHYINFLYADMRFKHQSTHEKELVACKISVNPYDLLYHVHTITDYLLEFLDEETKFIFKTTDTNNVYITMTTKNSVKSTINLEGLIAEKLSEETYKNQFEVISAVTGNEVEVKIKIFSAT